MKARLSELRWRLYVAFHVLRGIPSIYKVGIIAPGATGMRLLPTMGKDMVYFGVIALMPPVPQVPPNVGYIDAGDKVIPFPTLPKKGFDA